MRFPWSAPPPPPPLPPPQLIDSTAAAIAVAVVSVVLAILMAILATKKMKKTAKRAALLNRLAALPEHLRLGVTLPGMRKLLSQLPSDAVEQVNANSPLDKTGEPKYPKNVTENGYVNQFFACLLAKEDKLAVCERLRKQGSPHVGEATVFVTWFLNTPIATLIDALANFLKEKELREEDTFFWLSDYAIRQTNVMPDLELLGDCVSAIGHTVMLMDPWHAPTALTRVYCIKEVYYTVKSGAQFDLVMPSAQQFAFEVALVDDFGSIKMSLSKVDVRCATCRNTRDTKAIMDELEQGVGLVECNALVIGLLREGFVAQGRAALARLPAAERGTSVLVSSMGLLLQDMGKPKEARPLLEEALQARRETLGDRHPSTLTSINHMGQLLTAMGQLEEARPMLEEALQARRETLGDRHPDTLTSINNIGMLLQAMGQLEEARPLYEEALQVQRETLGDRHPDTLHSMNNMGMLLKARGQLKAAIPLLMEALQARRERLGDRHPDTMNSINNAGQLLLDIGQLKQAKPLLEEALQACKETLGYRHPETLISMNKMGMLLKARGQREEARPLLEEALQACRETLGGSHPDTLTSINNIGMLLQDMGELEEARPLYEEALHECRQTLGDRHPDTLHSMNNMGQLLQRMGELKEARPVLEEALQGRREKLGDHHSDTMTSIYNLASLLGKNSDIDSDTNSAANLFTEARRAKRVVLPEHLRLGVTLLGMRELLKQLPNDAVNKVNLHNAKYPPNLSLNGYVNQYFITLEAEGKEDKPGDRLAVCERLQRQESPHVGEATVFVSWFLDTPIDTLLDALANFLKQKGMREEDTFFWVCDYVIRQTDVKTDLAYLGDCVSALGHTVLMMEPWNNPEPLKRAYCIKEVYHTQLSGATFDMAMSTKEQEAFESALMNSDIKLIQEGLSVDVEQATCRNIEDKNQILSELEHGVGSVECNRLVVGLMRDALAAQAKAVQAR